MNRANRSAAHRVPFYWYRRYRLVYNYWSGNYNRVRLSAVFGHFCTDLRDQYQSHHMRRDALVNENIKNKKKTQKEFAVSFIRGCCKTPKYNYLLLRRDVCFYYNVWPIVRFSDAKQFETITTTLLSTGSSAAGQLGIYIFFKLIFTRLSRFIPLRFPIRNNQRLISYGRSVLIENIKFRGSIPVGREFLGVFLWFSGKNNGKSLLIVSVSAQRCVQFFFVFKKNVESTRHFIRPWPY